MEHQHHASVLLLAFGIMLTNTELSTQRSELENRLNNTHSSGKRI